ncbi:MAG TPA: gamma-glutamyltransferase [Xanthomonadaceae bacterium]|nr:gamma-glutamyltransferase [Xanthomonadaceae bacterium]
MSMRAMWLALSLLAPAVAAPAEAPVGARPPGAAIASAHSLATDAGFEILAAGGNAFDAAVATAAVLSVVEQTSSGIGGGGFYLLHFGDGRDSVFVDAREVAPAAVRAADYLDAEGNLDRDRSVNGPLSAGIPGAVAAMEHVSSRYGTLPLARTLQPAIRIAREGFPVYEKLARMAAARAQVLARYPASATLYLPGGEPVAVGHRLLQPDLAWSIGQIAEHGAEAFYRGELAQRILAGVRAAGGNWTAQDLAGYRVVEREPIAFDYGGHRIVTAPPPSSGGVALATMLNVLSGYELQRLETAPRVHLIVEAMRRAYRDRTLYLGDPDFVEVPVGRLVHPHYAAGLRASIRLDRATPSGILPGIESSGEGTDTSHLSIIDSEGNAVSATLTVNLPFGSGFTAPGTGIILNNEMDDFALKAGVPNAYGLIGVDANAPEPGKRMLSSMTPTIVHSPDRLAVIGTPGGGRIITMVLTGVLELIRGAHPREVVAAPRFHHQYLPDVISAEPGALDVGVRRWLGDAGHTISDGEQTWGNLQVVAWDKRAGTLAGGSDPRSGAGKARVEIADKTQP